MQKAVNEPLEKALQATRAIYSEIDHRPVSRDCVRRTECCQFKLTGRTPMLTAGEALVVAAALRASGRRCVPDSGDAATGRCPLLDLVGRCVVYEARPFGCRTHFCAAAGGPYSRNEVRDLVRRLETIDAQLGGDGPHAISIAVESALEVLERPRRRG